MFDGDFKPVAVANQGVNLLVEMLGEAVEAKLDEKYCPKCGFTMSRKLDFGKDKRSKDGLNKYCKDCIAEYN